MVILQKCKEKVIVDLLEEGKDAILWFPIILSLGIIARIAYNIEGVFVRILSIFLLITLCCWKQFHTKVTNKTDFFNIICYASFFFCIGITVMDMRITKVQAPKLSSKINAHVEGIVDSIYKTNNHYKVLLTDLNISKIHASDTPHTIRVRVSKKHSTVLKDYNNILGARVSFDAQLSPPQTIEQQYPFDFAQFAYFQRIGAVGFSLTNFHILKESEHSILHLPEIIRHKIASHIDIELEHDISGVVNGLLLGEIYKIPKHIYEYFRISGTSHVIAISGMHITVMSIMMLYVIKFFLLRTSISIDNILSSKISYCVVCALIVLYLLVVNSPISGVRAVSMFLLCGLGIVVDKRYDIKRVLATTASLILLFQPESILNAGMQLSFLACIGMIYCIQNLQFGFDSINYENTKLRNVFIKLCIYFQNLVTCSIIVTICTIPVIAFHFHTLSIYSIFANLVIIPLVDTIVMPLSMIYLATSFIDYSKYALQLLAIPVKLMIYFAKYFAELKYAAISVKNISKEIVVALSLGNVIIMYTKTDTMKLIGFFILSSALLLLL
ncbi:ComEC/Rec2 family competence protein [Candidatus Fokinia crypta]|uniref:ComEC family competence protein n=1 Tax=Candidatus Fokinia crypta TaxID=1920990 RepID=A0ABZ0URY2_9RICK|nr:ComEC/Rec2 family competence protein [Candidatus Fokinia cryptica]WPX97650.1 ComEC family competence protein [Candidatus Fokinia cryptica]